MPHRPRTRPFLVAAALSALLVTPHAHAGGLTFTYAADQGAGGSAFALGELALEPVLGPVTLNGTATFRPSGRSFRITIDDAAVPDGTRVPVGVWQKTGRTRTYSQHCVPVGSPHGVAVVAKAEVTLLIEGATLYPWHQTTRCLQVNRVHGGDHNRPAEHCAAVCAGAQMQAQHAHLCESDDPANHRRRLF